MGYRIQDRRNKRLQRVCDDRRIAERLLSAFTLSGQGGIPLNSSDKSDSRRISGGRLRSLVEDKASGQSLIQELKLSTNYPVIPVPIDRDKETRASAVTGYFESGRVLFPADAPWLADLEDELASFPGGLHDDQVDAITQALNRMRDAGGVLGLVNFFKDLAAGKRKVPRSFEEAEDLEAD